MDAAIILAKVPLFSVYQSPPQTLPVAEKTYLFKELYTEIIIRNPKRLVGLSGYR